MRISKLIHGGFAPQIYYFTFFLQFTLIVNFFASSKYMPKLE